ncbi:hypothetical protein KKF38_02035 [Patescibacteria group bacterium]|nr:hypothetical protein [Patescibacteria group bacterium]
MTEKTKGITSPQESLDDLKYQLKRVEQEHAQLLQALQNNPKDSQLRVDADRVYDRWRQIQRKMIMIQSEDVSDE